MKSKKYKIVIKIRAKDMTSIYLEYIHESIRIGKTKRSKVVITAIDAIVVVTESGDT